MGYRRPEDVVAPKALWSLKAVLCNTGQDGWSVAEGQWHGKLELAMRWNGDDESGSRGSPQSTGHPTWMIIPKQLAPSIRESANRMATALSMIDCKLDHPTGYDLGVFLIKVSLNKGALALLASEDLHFDIPDLGPQRLFRRDEEHPEQFLAPLKQGGDWQGSVVKGSWQAVVQTNGVEEHKNEITKQMIQDAVRSRVATSLALFL